MTDWLSDELLMQVCASVLLVGGLTSAFSRKLMWLGIGLQCLIVFFVSLRFAFDYSGLILLGLILSALIPMTLQDRKVDPNSSDFWLSKTEKIILSVGVVAMFVVGAIGFGQGQEIQDLVGTTDSALLLPTVFFVVSVIYSIKLLRGDKHESP